MTEELTKKAHQHSSDRSGMGEVFGCQAGITQSAISAVQTCFEWSGFQREKERRESGGVRGERRNKFGMSKNMYGQLRSPTRAATWYLLNTRKFLMELVWIII